MMLWSGGIDLKAILFVGHGSRDPEGNQELLRFTERVAQHLDEPIIETCFLELAHPDIPQGIARCVEQGATEITLIPLMLFSAGHAKIHIPLCIHEAQEEYPEIKFTYGRPFEVDEAILSILEQRLRSVHPNREQETAVLIVGRGSSDMYANSDLYKMARMFWEKIKVKWVEVSFIGVTEPLFDEGIERCVRLGAKGIVVIPYFLFTGVLIKRMEAKIAEFRNKYPEVTMNMSRYLGFDDGLIETLLKRIQEAEEGMAFSWQELANKAIAEGHEPHHHHHHHHNHDEGHSHSHNPERDHRYTVHKS